MNTKKKQNIIKTNLIKILKFVLSVAIIFGIGYAVFNYVPFFAKYNTYAIGSSSMDPVLKFGDLVVIDTSVPLEDLEAGSIIAFYTDKEGDGITDVVVHYLYSINDDGTIRTYRTKPNVSDDIDSWVLTDEDIIGIHKFTVKRIGSFLMFGQTTIGRIMLIVDIVVIYVAVELFTAPSKKKKQKKTEEKDKLDTSNID